VAERRTRGEGEQESERITVWLESGASRVGANPFPWLFGWRMGGLSWLQGEIFLSDAGWLRPSKSEGWSRSSRVGLNQPVFSFNFLQPNTERVGSVPKIRSATKHWTSWLHPQKLGWIQPTPPNPQPNTRLGFGRVYMKPFSINQISAIHLRSTAQIIHGLNMHAGFSGPKAKLRPKPRLEG
jgi:hypothetical protein